MPNPIGDKNVAVIKSLVDNKISSISVSCLKSLNGNGLNHLLGSIYAPIGFNFSARCYQRKITRWIISRMNFHSLKQKRIDQSSEHEQYFHFGLHHVNAKWSGVFRCHPQLSVFVLASTLLEFVNFTITRGLCADYYKQIERCQTKPLKFPWNLILHNTISGNEMCRYSESATFWVFFISARWRHFGSHHNFPIRLDNTGNLIVSDPLLCNSL